MSNNERPKGIVRKIADLPPLFIALLVIVGMPLWLFLGAYALMVAMLVAMACVAYPSFAVLTGITATTAVVARRGRKGKKP